MAERVSELRSWSCEAECPCHLFVDAASAPARCAAVLEVDGHFKYTDTAPPLKLMEKLKERKDKQIMSLEIMAIMLALETFAKELERRKVVLYSDNIGAEKACSSGRA